jgi:hypothetical protein
MSSHATLEVLPSRDIKVRSGCTTGSSVLAPAAQHAAIVRGLVTQL